MTFIVTSQRQVRQVRSEWPIRKRDSTPMYGCDRYIALISLRIFWNTHTLYCKLVTQNLWACVAFWTLWLASALHTLFTKVIYNYTKKASWRFWRFHSNHSFYVWGEKSHIWYGSSRESKYQKHEFQRSSDMKNMALNCQHFNSHEYVTIKARR